MVPDRDELKCELLAAFAEGVDTPWPEERFADLAVRLFAHQYARNEPYRRLCDARRVTPEAVADWREVPAVATAAFKSAALCTFPPEEAVAVYETSGTTLHGRRGRHFLRDTELYDASLAPNLKAHLFPDVERIRIAVLGPGPEADRSSSLAHMLVRAVRLWGAGGSRFSPPGGASIEALAAELAGAGAPVCLMGVSFAFVHLIDYLEARDLRIRLPEGSRIMDTGGYKGRSREVPKAELYGAYGERLGVPEHRVVNEYGMTEMGSQFYDTTLRDFLAGRERPRHKVPPPWVRTVIVDPETLAPVRPGEVGLLRHFDLANLDSVMAIQTDDLGVAVEDGFEVLGRAVGAEPRGCSLAVDDLPQATQ